MTRTHNDTWDLATSVGATATMVAAARAIATNSDEKLIDDRFAEPLVRAVGVDFLTRWATGELTADDLDDETAGWGLRYMPYAMAARTKFFDKFFADAAAAGIRQAVILASGLDSRAYRLSWPDGATVFEIDQPEVIAFKRTTLSSFGATPTVKLVSLAIDLRDDWQAALLGAGFDPSQPSAWIAEGLFGYLPPDAQDGLLDAVTALAAPGSRLGTEAVPNHPEPDESARARMRDATEKWREHGFDLDFGELTFEGERHDVDTYLAGRGWTSEGVTLETLLERNGFPSMPRLDDAPSMADVTYYTSVRS